MCVVTTVSDASVSARSGRADRHTTGTVSRNRSTSLLRHSTAAAAADDDDVVMSSSVTDVDPVSVQRALRTFSKQLFAAEKERVSHIQSLTALVM